MCLLEGEKAARSRNAGGGLQNELLGGGLENQNIAAPSALQAFRAAWIARRYAVSPDTAILLATLALGEVRA